MELEQLRQLDAIEREGTMSAAARALHVSQPALSRSVQRLEAELGAELFDRTGRHVALNEAGRAAVEWARQILRDERLMRDAVDAAVRRSRTLRVATVAPVPLWRLTSLMVERFPRETLTSETLEEGMVERGVSDGTFDLGIVTGRPALPLLRSCEMMRENLSVTLPPSHSLAARRSVGVAELDGNAFLIISDIGFWRGRVDASLPHATFVEQRDREVFARLVRSTPLCAFTTDAPFLGDPIPGRAVVPIDDPMAHAVFYLVARADAMGLAAELFAWVRSRSESAAESAESGGAGGVGAGAAGGAP